MIRFLCRHPLAVTIGGVFAALIGNVWRDAGTTVMLLLLLAAGGLAAAVVAVMWTQGTAVVHHARREAKAIEAIHAKKEIAR